MVRQSNDGNGTQLSHWFRKQGERLPSTRRDIPNHNYYECAPGLFSNVNLDFVWRCYNGENKGKWMIIEEKRKLADISYAQKNTFELLERACSADTLFCGFHLIQFEETCFYDGFAKLDGEIISETDFICFLRFEFPSSWYKFYFINSNFGAT